MVHIKRANLTVLVEGHIHEDRDFPVMGYCEGDNYTIGTQEFPNFGSPHGHTPLRLGRDQLRELNPLLGSLQRMGNAVDLVLLIDSIGGQTHVAKRIESACRLTRSFGGTVWAFNREKALSAAGWLFVEADKRVANDGAEIMLHQGIMYRRGPLGRRFEAQVPLTYAENPETFRQRVRAWAKTVTHISTAIEAEEVIETAISGIHPLDEVLLDTEQLNRWGLLEACTQDPQSFLRQYCDVTGIRPELLPTQFKEFLLS